MKYFKTLWVVLLVVVPLGASLQADTGGVSSLRGDLDLDKSAAASDFKTVPDDRKPLHRDYLHQPPLIPHQIRDYHIDTNSNKCLSCHSWGNYKSSGATKISLTHYDARNGQQLSDVSPRRYFCLQCHVPQVNAKPLVGNQFESVESMN